MSIVECLCCTVTKVTECVNLLRVFSVSLEMVSDYFSHFGYLVAESLEVEHTLK